MSRAESEAVCSPLLGFPLGSGRKREQFLWLPPRDPSVCRQGASPGTPGWEGPRATPGGSCEQVQLDTYPSPTTTHLMACIWAARWAAAAGRCGERRRARGEAGGRARGCGRQGAGCRGRCPRRLALRRRNAGAQRQPPPKAGENCRETGNGRSTHIRPPLPRAGAAAPRLRGGAAPARAAPGLLWASGDARERSATLGSDRRPRGAQGWACRHLCALG